MVTTDTVLQQLADTLQQRKASAKEGNQKRSYVASLYAGGDDAILKKVGEEATEFILAAKGNGSGRVDSEHLVAETADLWFHTMVMLVHKDIDVSCVLTELESRFDQSGIDEKEARKSK